MTWGQALADRAESLFAAHADAEKATQMAAYMKDHFAYFGLPQPARKALVRDLKLGRPDRAQLLASTEALWAKEQRELHYLAIDLLIKHQKVLEEQDLPWLRGLLTTHSWWDSVDPLASHVLGSLLWRYRELCSHLDDWIACPNLWLARSALLFQLRYKDETDFERLSRYILTVCHSGEFFLRKAIGWALREYSKHQPDRVVSFVETNADKLSGLSRREALKWLERKKKSRSKPGT
ncbi:MAG: DNA alkylation repair protein [Vulcanimicrobiota bacterium]